MNEIAETLERALKNATNTINFWRARAESTEADADALRHQLATVTALVPEADLIQQASQMMWHTCESCPTLRVNCPGYEDDRTNGLCTVLARQLVRLAVTIRAWREGQGQEAQDG